MFFLLFYLCLLYCCCMFLCNYEVQINIGVYEFEKKGEQCVLINIELYVLLEYLFFMEDKLYEVVDYDFMCEIVVCCMV